MLAELALVVMLAAVYASIFAYARRSDNEELRMVTDWVIMMVAKVGAMIIFVAAAILFYRMFGIIPDR